MPVKNLAPWIVLVAALPVLGGCSWMRSMRTKACHEPQPYQKAQTLPPLKIPAGLDTPDYTNALRLPQLNEPPAPARTGSQPCLDEPPSFKVQQPARAPQA